MSGVFGALFSGQAAQTTDESLRRWRQLFQAEEQMELQREQLEQTATLQEDSQAHAIELAKLQAQLANENLDRQEAFKVGETLFTSQEEGRTPLDQQYAIAETLSASGNRWAKLYEDNIRSSLNGSSEDTIAAIDALFTAKPGDKFNAIQYRAAAPAYANFAGLEGKERENFIQQVNDLVSHYNSLGAEVEDAAMRRLEAEVTNLEETVNATRANIASTKAGTELTKAQTVSVGTNTARTLQLMEQDKELHPLLMEGQRQQNALWEQQTIRETIQNGVLPEQLAANLALSWEQVKEHKLANDYTLATFNDMVRKVQSEADISEENARHLVATGLLRDALKSNELDRGIQLLTTMGLEEEGQRLANENARLSNEGQELKNKELRLSMLNTLAQEGRPEQVAALGEILLAPLGFSEEDNASILGRAQELAGQRQVTISDLEGLQVKVAEAEARSKVANADLDEWKAANAEESQQFEQWAERERIAVSQENARIYGQSVAAQYGLDGNVREISIPNLLGEVEDKLGYGFSDIREKVSEYNTIEGDLSMLNLGAESGGVPADLQNKYGITDRAVLQEELARQLEVKQMELEGDITGFLSAGVGLSGGLVIPPDALGLTSEAGQMFYRNATMGMPWFRQREEEENDRTSQVYDRVNQIAENTADVFGPLGALTGGASEVYNTLLEEFGEERLQEANINHPSDLLSPLSAKSQAYAANFESSENAVNTLNGQGFSLENDFQGRRQASTIYRSYIGGAEALRRQVQDWNDGGMLGMGRDNDRALELGSTIRSFSPLTYTDLVNRGVLTLSGSLGTKQAVTAYLDDFIFEAANNVQSLEYINLRKPN
jgi:hypothetical protein